MKAISILAYGADPTAQRLATSAIQQAINSAQQNDVIVIPQGRFLTGALFLKSGVSLRLDAGAQLVGSQDLADYPLINTRVAGIDMRWPAGIINIIDCENVSITGTGTIDGQGAIWWQRYWGDDERSGMVGDYSARGLRWVVDYDCQRPRNILVFESQSILLRDFTSRESGFWNMHLSDKPEHWRKLAEGVEGEAGLTAVSGLTIKNMTARRSDSKCFSRAFFIEGYPERPVVGLTLEGILIDASEFGKISGVDELRFKDVQVTAVEITLDRNDSYER